MSRTQSVGCAKAMRLYAKDQTLDIVRLAVKCGISPSTLYRALAIQKAKAAEVQNV